MNIYTAFKLPETGDNSRIALWVALMGLSAVGFIMLIKRRKTC